MRGVHALVVFLGLGGSLLVADCGGKTMSGFAQADAGPDVSTGATTGAGAGGVVQTGSGGTAAAGTGGSTGAAASGGAAPGPGIRPDRLQDWLRQQDRRVFRSPSAGAVTGPMDRLIAGFKALGKPCFWLRGYYIPTVAVDSTTAGSGASVMHVHSGHGFGFFGGFGFSADFGPHHNKKTASR